MHRRGPHLFCSLLATLLACTVGDEGGSSFSDGASAGEGASASVSDGVGSGETARTDDHGSGGGSDDDAASGGAASEASSAAESGVDEASSDVGEASSDDSTGSATDDDGGSSSTGTPDDLDDGILDIVVTAHDDCTFTTVPTSITVPEGTEFTVNWISAASSDIEFDIAKIDPFNQVPIVIGMEPGTAYHDEVRSWCGALFTGTFDFRVTSCFDPQYIPVDCGG